MLTPHPSSALEYFYFKVNAGPVALLVDWIERRRSNEHVLRVSVHSPLKREVIFEDLNAFMPDDNFLVTHRTVGHAGKVSWDLGIDLGPEQIQPDIFPAGLLKMPDTLYVSAPLAAFTGWIRHGAEKVEFKDVGGAVTQYWGRQLLPEWWWLSAQQLDVEGAAVECCVFRTRLWGTCMQMPFAFVFLHRDGKSELLMAPPYSTQVEGSPDRFTIEFSRRGRESLTLSGTGRAYGDLGEGIINTLTGDLEIREDGRVIARASGTAGLERRLP